MKKCLVLLLTLIVFSGVILSAETVNTADSSEVSVPKDSTFVSPSKQFLRQSIVPVSLATTSMGILAFPSLKYSIQDQLNWNKAESIILYDDQLRYLPTCVMAALSLVGVKGEHKLWEQLLLTGATYVVSDFIVFRLKEATHVNRPFPSIGTESFPSQHTAQAFLAATLLHKEYGHISPWISIGGYSVAAWVGYARIARNRHFTTDVLMGSAVGIFSANLSYWVYDLIPKSKRKQIDVLPIVSQNSAELLFVCKL